MVFRTMGSPIVLPTERNGYFVCMYGVGGVRSQVLHTMTKDELDNIIEKEELLDKGFGQPRRYEILGIL